MVSQPNIFDYATSELSQDAFLCYLISFGKEEYKEDFPREYILAHKFLAKCGINEKEEILSVQRQVEHVDVLVTTKNYILIIEDKTYTNEHDDQIIRYVQSIRMQDNSITSDKIIKVCYFKTGDYVYEYETSDDSVLPQENCCSLRRDDMLELLENNCAGNLIFESFYQHFNFVKERVKACDDADIMTWNAEKWFDYLYKILQGHKFNIGWVHNARGGFYGCWFDWYNVTGGENYKQIEISFASNNKTAQVKMCYKFSGKDKETTLNNKASIKDLQRKVVADDFIPSNRIGKTTTYAYKIAKDKSDIEKFIGYAL